MEAPERLRPYTVSELTAELKVLLEEVYPAVWVEGEISNLRRPTSGHLYFTLKDDRAQIRAVMFRGRNQRLRFRPEDGLAVLVHGTLSIYEPRGEYQVVVEAMEPKGLGALQLAFEQLKARLAAEGLFDEARKRPIPLLPRRIGIVTSPTGAALRDILQVLERRFATVDLLIHPVPVQGDQAPPEIEAALDALNRRGDLEVIILARGGGSLEDLWAFNEERVARAIARSKIPIISAIGHETDFTIADFVADLRAPTPSAAAELVIARKGEIAQRLDDLWARMLGVVEHRVAAARQRATALERHLRLLSPVDRVRLQRERLAELLRALEAEVGARLLRWRGAVQAAAGKLDALSPLAILARGYSLTRRLPDLAVVREAAAAPAGTEVLVTLARGGLVCGVKATQE
jgi:exodeoxyribonuclease VII large subunit